MPILKDGIILKNKLFFEQTEKNYYCSLCYGTWNPGTSSSELIIGSESTPTRFSPVINTGWNDDTGTDFVNITFTVNYPEDIIYNRLVLYYGGLQRSLYDVVFNGFNSLTIVSPELNNFIVGDRILYDNGFYEIISINGYDLGLSPLLNVPNLPNTGDGIIRDASCVPLIGVVLNDVYVIENNISVNFLINGGSE